MYIYIYTYTYIYIYICICRYVVVVVVVIIITIVILTNSNNNNYYYCPENLPARSGSDDARMSAYSGDTRRTRRYVGKRVRAILTCKDA